VQLKHYHWSTTSYNGRTFYHIGINYDGSLYNPNGYPEDDARAAALAADERKNKELIEARKRGVVTRQRRKEQRIANIARDYLLGKHIGNLSDCAICGRRLTDPVSVERGIGSECWPRLMDYLAGQVPKCEREIAGHRAAISELEQQDFAYWKAKYIRYGDLADKLAASDYRRARERIEQAKRQLADAEILLEAAQRWHQAQPDAKSP
jgi:hypothetical protein